MYTEVYEELFARVPDHPQLTGVVHEKEHAAAVSRQVRVLERFLRPDSCFLEVGAGDCALSSAIAEKTRGEVHAVDVSPTITELSDLSARVQVHLTDGRTIPVPDGSIDLAYSSHLIEHLHPDDALEQTTNVCRAVREGGSYVCITPNRLSGPHDISKFFDDEATGFHLHEYTTLELATLFKRAGFRKTSVVIPLRGCAYVVPLPFISTLERLLLALPRKLGYKVSGETPLAGVFGRVVGQK